MYKHYFASLETTERNSEIAMGISQGGHMPDRIRSRSRIDLQPKQLRHFLEVVETGSISAACEVLNITQPALSKSIKQLEQRLGVKLFERLPTGVALTRYQTLLVRPEGDGFGVVAGRRRYYALMKVAEETGKKLKAPCGILDSDDDALAIEASLIENLARLPASELDSFSVTKILGY